VLLLFITQQTFFGNSSQPRDCKRELSMPMSLRIVVLRCAVQMVFSPSWDGEVSGFVFVDKI